MAITLTHSYLPGWGIRPSRNYLYPSRRLRRYIQPPPDQANFFEVCRHNFPLGSLWPSSVPLTLRGCAKELVLDNDLKFPGSVADRNPQPATTPLGNSSCFSWKTSVV